MNGSFQMGRISEVMVDLQFCSSMSVGHNNLQLKDRFSTFMSGGDGVGGIRGKNEEDGAEE